MDYYNYYNEPGFFNQHGIKIGIGVIIIIVILVFYFTRKSGGEKVVEEATTDDEEPVIREGSQRQLGGAGGLVRPRLAVEAKFKNQVMDPSPQVFDTAARMSFNTLNTDSDELITADEIPDGDLKEEILGYDVNGDGNIDLDEYKEYFKNRKKE